MTLEKTHLCNIYSAILSSILSDPPSSRRLAAVSLRQDVLLISERHGGGLLFWQTLSPSTASKDSCVQFPRVGSSTSIVGCSDLSGVPAPPLRRPGSNRPPGTSLLRRRRSRLLVKLPRQCRHLIISQLAKGYERSSYVGRNRPSLPPNPASTAEPIWSCTVKPFRFKRVSRTRK